MTPTVQAPPFGGMAAFATFTVDQYDEMVRQGILDKDDRVVLLEGYVVLKMPANGPHENTVVALVELMTLLRPPGWVVRSQVGINASTSRPEPDVYVARGDRKTYAARRSAPADLGLVVEVSDSTLASDRVHKARIYARDRIPVYWVVNLPERRVEVYTDPTGPGDEPRYATVRHFPAGTAVPVELDGQAVAATPVDELLP
jgi:Uma2 family endonuclease